MSFDNDQTGCEKIGPSPHKIMIMAFPFKEGSAMAYAWLWYICKQKPCQQQLGYGCKIFILAKNILLNQFAKFVEKNGFPFGKLE